MRRVLVRHPCTAALTSVMAMCLLGPQSITLAENEPPSLDELLDIDTPRDQHNENAETPIPTDPGAIKLDDRISQRLADPKQPALFEQAVREMRRASLRLEQAHDPGLQTQRLQRSVLSKLDQLIASAKKQPAPSVGPPDSGAQARPQETGSPQDAPRPGSSGAPTSAASSAASAGSASDPSHTGPGQADDTHTNTAQMWGQLPPRLRDELRQGLSEHFSSIYRQLTEEYYRRLAQEPQ